MGKEKDLTVAAMASSTVPCHASQYSRPKKLKKSPSSLPLGRPSLEQSLDQSPWLRCAQKKSHPLHVSGLSSVSL